MEKIVYFVRHGQSLANAAAIFQPPNSPLSETGRRQAACLAQRVSKLTVETLYRARWNGRRTAHAIAEATGLEPEYSDLFVERVKPPSIDGKPFADPEAHAVWTEWNKSLYTPGMRVGGGENFDDLIARADAALAFLEARAEASITVVTHGYFLRTVVACAVLGDMLSGRRSSGSSVSRAWKTPDLRRCATARFPAESAAGASSSITTTPILADASDRRHCLTGHGP